MKKIIVDMFGADAGPEIVVRGAFQALKAQKEYDLVLAGSSVVAQIVLQEEAAKDGIHPSEILPRVSVIETSSFVTNTENPKNMVKERNDTSMILSMEALKNDEEICAMVTAGSTGCALVGSCFHLGLQKGLLQPALASALPKAGGGFVILLDCGSNLEPKPKEMAQYARLGAALSRDSYRVEDPKVGLINVGKEKGKGTEVLKEAFDKIEAEAEEYGFDFIGNIEGSDILSGKADVAVCDGFTGNVVLKGFEQAGLLAAGMADEEGSEKIRSFFDYNNQAGAIFLGTNKIIIKAHGAATKETICSCILQAISLVSGKMNRRES